MTRSIQREPTMKKRLRFATTLKNQLHFLIFLIDLIMLQFFFFSRSRAHFWRFLTCRLTFAMERIYVHWWNRCKSGNSSRRGISDPLINIIILRMRRKLWKRSKTMELSWWTLEMLTSSTATWNSFLAWFGRWLCVIKSEGVNSRRGNWCWLGCRLRCLNARFPILHRIGTAEFCCPLCWIIVNLVKFNLQFQKHFLTTKIFHLGLFPHWKSLDPNQSVRNCENAMNLAHRNFGVPKVLEPEYLASPWLDELSGMTYLSYFMKPDGPGYNASMRWVNSTIKVPVNNFTVSWIDLR